jgi:hypothetical protein
MTPTALRVAPDALFRSSPDLEMVPLERLTDPERRFLAELPEDPDRFGLARSPSQGALLAVDRDDALLLFTLREPGILPEFLRSGKGKMEGVARLVLDGLLEVQRGGRFVSGPQALEGSGSKASSQGILAQLSERALRYAGGLAIQDASRLAARLYFFNRLPVTARWIQAVRQPEDFLGVAPGGPLREALGPYWRRRGTPSEGWLMWRRKRGNGAHRASRNRPHSHYKLYVSPHPDALADAFAALVRHLPQTRATAFKVAQDAFGLLRPDKIIVYFEDFETLSEDAHQLAPALADLPAQGVPFTAQVTPDGMLSWGIDPPRSESAASGPGQSWRLWLVSRLAQYVLAARRRPNKTVPAWRFALERLRLEGIDVEGWTPSLTLWQKPTLLEV